MQTETTTVINPKTIWIASGILGKSHLDWSPDGASIVFSYNRGATDMVSFSLSGENLGVLNRIDENITLGFFGHPALSPDGTKLAYQSFFRNHLWVVSLIDGAEMLLTPDHPFAHMPCWSLNGNYIAYSVWGVIWIVPSTGGSAQQITSESDADYYSPCFSPDGTKLAVDSGKSENYDIWIISVDSVEARQLTSNLAPDRNPVWSPDGSQIAFESTRNDTTAIWLIPATGGEEIRLTKNYAWASFPVWSPDGSKIAFRTSYNRSCVISVPQGDIIGVLNSEQGYPMWLPDGNTLLLPQSVDFSINSVISIDTREITNITFGCGDNDDKYPTWFSDNSSIAFVRGNNIWTMTSSGGNAVPLTNDSTSARYYLEISPDGAEIAYDNGYDIFIQPVNGDQPINVTNNIREKLTQPTWSPAGEQIACCVPYGLKIFSFESDQLVETAFVPGNFSNPSWSCEHAVFGSHIAVESSNNIYVISPEKLKPELVMLYGQYPCWSPDGIKIAYLSGYNIFITTVFQELGN